MPLTPQHLATLVLDKQKRWSTLYLIFIAGSGKTSNWMINNDNPTLYYDYYDTVGAASLYKIKAHGASLLISVLL